MQTGVGEEALAITARYVSEREQFGARLGTFQAVGQRVADAYIDTEGIRLTALQAIWRLDAGVDASEELLTAKFWAGAGAQRVVHAAQHLHGGIDRKRVVSGTRVSGRVDLGGRRNIQKKKKH